MPAPGNISLEEMTPADKKIVKQFFVNNFAFMERLLSKIAQAMLDLQLIGYYNFAEKNETKKQQNLENFRNHAVTDIKNFILQEVGVKVTSANSKKYIDNILQNILMSFFDFEKNEENFVIYIISVLKNIKFYDSFFNEKNIARALLIPRKEYYPYVPQKDEAFQRTMEFEGVGVSQLQLKAAQYGLNVTEKILFKGLFSEILWLLLPANMLIFCVALISENILIALVLSIIFLFIFVKFYYYRVSRKKSYFRVEYMLDSFREGLFEAITVGFNNKRAEIQEILALQPSGMVTSSRMPPEVSSAPFNGDLSVMPNVATLDFYSHTDTRRGPLLKKSGSPSLVPESKPSLFSNRLSGPRLMINWTLPDRPEIIRYQEGDYYSNVYLLREIEPDYGHFIWWNQEKLINENPRSEKLLKIFKSLVVGGMVRNPKGDQGIIRCDSEDDKALGVFKIKSLGQYEAAKLHRLYCHKVATVTVAGVDRILYEAYKLVKTH